MLHQQPASIFRQPASYSKTWTNMGGKVNQQNKSCTSYLFCLLLTEEVYADKIQSSTWQQKLQFAKATGLLYKYQSIQKKVLFICIAATSRTGQDSLSKSIFTASITFINFIWRNFIKDTIIIDMPTAKDYKLFQISFCCIPVTSLFIAVSVMLL